MTKKLVSIVICTCILITTFGITGFSDVSNKDVNYFLEKIATNETYREEGVSLLEIFIDNDNPDVESLKDFIRDHASEEDVQKLTTNGYTLEQALSGLDILGELSSQDRTGLLTSMRAGNTTDMKNIISQYTGSSKSQSKGADVQQKPIEIVTKKNFNDTENHWAKEAIQFMAEKGIIEGYDDGNYLPNKQITRAEFAALIVRLLQFNHNSESLDIPFEDINKDAWYYDVIKIAYELGLITGQSSNTFNPKATITREEMALVIIRAIEKTSKLEQISDLEAKEALLPFKDASGTSQWSEISFGKAVKLGLLNGRSDVDLVPKGQLTRAESAVILKRVYDNYLE